MPDWQFSTDVRAIQPGVTRYCNPATPGDPPPFPGFGGPPVATPGTAGRVAPEFKTHDERFIIRLRAAAGADLYGLGEVAGPLRHSNRRITGSTSDSYGYDASSENLYQAHPWLLAVRPDGSAFGVIVETTWAFTCHMSASVIFETRGVAPAVTVIEDETPQGVLTALAELIGTTPMLPRWALGFQQSKWSYEPDAEVLRVAREFRERQLPADVVWIDIDYMDKFRVFTFDPRKFPDPATLNADLHEIGWKAAWMIDPGLAAESGYPVYDSAVAGDHLLRSADGAIYEGTVWPPVASFPDYTSDRTRRWWADLYGEFMATGIDAVWNDMNEPTTIDDVPDQALPLDLRHDADAELGGPDNHARYRNVYGMLMTRASRDGISQANPDKRPFLLTRSTFLGGHRYASTWTGDNLSNWEHLGYSIPMALNLGMSGQPIAGPDIGGFGENCDGALLARWMGIGCLLPFARNHSMKHTDAQEPWVFGTDVEATCRRALERRYRLLPYLYTLLREAATTGLPLVRPAFFAAPTDPAMRDVEDCFLLGGDLYVRASVDPTAGPSSPVPDGWQQISLLDDPTTELGDSDLPELYLRPGAIVPIGPVMQYADEVPLTELTLIRHGEQASGLLYEDAGDGHGHLEGEFRLTQFSWAGALTAEVIEGSWPLGDWTTAVREA